MTEKGVSDLAQHFLAKAGITVLRRLRKTDNNRVARAVGATIVNQPELMTEKDVGTECGLFEVKLIGDEYFTYLDQCKNPKACTIMLRGASKDVLNEIERNLLDAMGVVRNILLDPRVVPGGGASELAMAEAINRSAARVEGVMQWPFKTVASALEVIPRTLIENCGGSTIRLLTELRAKHAEEKGLCTWGVDGNKGEACDMKELKIWEPMMVKQQTIKTAVESACMLLRIDDIVSGISGKGAGSSSLSGGADEDKEDETFGDNRDG